MAVALFLLVGYFFGKRLQVRQHERMVAQNRIPARDAPIVELGWRDQTLYAELVREPEAVKKHFNGRLGFLPDVRLSKAAGDHEFTRFREGFEVLRDVGMLVVFEPDAPCELVLEDVRIDVQVAFLKPDGWIVEVYDVPEGRVGAIAPDMPCRYALVMSAGRFNHHGLRVGETIRVPRPLEPRSDFTELGRRLARENAPSPNEKQQNEPKENQEP